MKHNFELLPIAEHLSENLQFKDLPDCDPETLQMSIDFYKRVGFVPPWICYFVSKENKIIGGAAFKGRPVNNKIEIAYGVFPPYRQNGFGTEICMKLIKLAQLTDPTVIITARTLPEENYSVKILRKNGFELLGTVFDEEDGNVWEWEYIKNK